MTKIKLTNTRVKSLPLSPSEYRDSEQPGLMVRVGKKSKSFYLKKSINGKQVVEKLGDFSCYSVDEARNLCRERLAELAGNKAAIARKQQKITLGQGYSHYMEEHVGIHCTKKTYSNYQGLWSLYLSEFQDEAMVSINPQTIRLFHRRVGKGSVFSANRCVELLKAIYNHCERRELISGVSNPGKVVHREVKKSVKYQERPRERIVEEHELGSFVEAVLGEAKATRGQSIPSMVVLLALTTGARRESILNMRVKDVCRVSGCWSIPAEFNKGKRKGYKVHLVPAVLKLVVERIDSQEIPSPWVFPNRVDLSRAMVEPKRGIKRIFKQQGLEDFTLHCLRHTVATHTAFAGIADVVRSSMLDHSAKGITNRVYTTITEQKRKLAFTSYWDYLLESIPQGREKEKAVAA